MTEKEKIQSEIKILQEKLQKLEALERTKSPIEILEAYKRWRGEYPPSDNFDDWSAFRMGYHYSLEDSAISATIKRLKEKQEPEENEWKLVALRFGEKLSDTGPAGYYDFTPDEWFEWALNEYEKTLKLLEKERAKSQERGERIHNEMEAKKLQDKEWNVDVKTNLKPNYEPKP